MVKFNKFNFVCIKLASINLFCVNHPSAACKLVGTLYSLYKRTMGQVIVSLLEHFH